MTSFVFISAFNAGRSGDRTEGHEGAAEGWPALRRHAIYASPGTVQAPLAAD